MSDTADPRCKVAAAMIMAAQHHPPGGPMDRLVRDLLRALDAADPLRVLLADDEAACRLIMDALMTADDRALTSNDLWSCATAVLVALREFK